MNSLIEEIRSRSQYHLQNDCRCGVCNWCIARADLDALVGLFDKANRVVLNASKTDLLPRLIGELERAMQQGYQPNLLDVVEARGILLVAGQTPAPETVPRTALYWFIHAKKESYTVSERLFYMENAYNHVVNAAMKGHPFGPCGYKHCDWPDGELRCNEPRSTEVTKHDYVQR